MMVDFATSSLKTTLPQPAPLALRQNNRLALSPEEQRVRIDQAAEQFESQFLSLMVDSMFTDIDSDGIFGGGQGEQIYRSFIAEEYGKAIAQSGGVGLADSIRSELLRLQEIPTAEGNIDA